jgi:tetratricopeptide (TPR) repeat protein
MRHPHPEDVARAMTGTASPRDYIEVLTHLLVCPNCTDYAGKVSPRAGHLLRELHDFAQENVVAQLVADTQWAEIRGLGVKAQKERIATTAACKTPAFARLLIEELANGVDWEENERLASLIAASINSMNLSVFPSFLGNDLRAEVMIELANSRRRAAEWKRSEEALLKANELLALGSGAKSLRARYQEIYGSLEVDRRNIEAALRAFEQSRILYHEVGHSDGVVRALLATADALTITDAKGALRDPQGVFDVLDRVDELLPPGDPLIAYASLLRAECLIAIGRPVEAARRLTYCERPRRGRMLIRYRFTGARLLHSLGHKKEAERLFHAVVTADLDNELFKDALLDLLYIVKLHVLEGDLTKALSACRRALGEVVLPQVAHEQLRSVWEATSNAIEARALLPEALARLQLYMSLHWRHPSPSPPFMAGSRSAAQAPGVGSSGAP